MWEPFANSRARGSLKPNNVLFVFHLRYPLHARRLLDVYARCVTCRHFVANDLMDWGCYPALRQIRIQIEQSIHLFHRSLTKSLDLIFPIANHASDLSRRSMTTAHEDTQQETCRQGQHGPRRSGLLMRVISHSNHCVQQRILQFSLLKAGMHGGMIHDECT
jgi:hypothetical protein